MADTTPQYRAQVAAVLASLYPNAADARQVVEAAGLDVLKIDFSGPPNRFWYAVVTHAAPRDELDDLVAYARTENPKVEALKLVADHEPPPVVAGPDADADWRGVQDRPTLERIIGKRSTLVPVSYLERGMQAARSVVRIRRADGGSGSGFLVADDLVVTNNHVLPAADVAAAAVAQCNYQQLADGADGAVESFTLRPDLFFRTSRADDWTAVRVEGSPAARFGTLPLAKGRPIAPGDPVNIIQHPGGGLKQVSLLANVVVFVGDGRVQYLTDTLPGSSGSPVFDASWTIVAVHHSGGWLSEPNAPAKTTYFRNEGILIDRVIDGLAAD